MTQQQPTHGYVGRRPCGCVCYVAVDLDGVRGSLASAVAEVIAEGGTVDRLPLAEVRAAGGLMGRCDTCDPGGLWRCADDATRGEQRW